MRSVSTPSPRRSCATPPAVAADLPAPGAASLAIASSAPTPRSTPHSSPVAPAATTPQVAPESADLVAENKTLNDRILQLTSELKCVLDHSIESDTRLLQYTNEVFVANVPRPTPPVRSTATCSVQCNMPAICNDKSCAETRALVDSLRTTIEVLEAELQCLRGGQNHQPAEEDNRIDILGGGPREGGRAVGPRACRPDGQGRSKRRSNRIKSTPIKTAKKVQLPFSFISIEGDSHSRGLAALVRQRVAGGTRVEGVCKPGARLLDATSDRPPPPNSCCVIVAGTNDVASGQQSNIYQHLERRITDRMRTAGVVVATLPHRHDLPASHPINQETVMVNHYIEELCVRHRGVGVLDFNRIGGSAFNGMHLRPDSRCLFAELVVESLRELTNCVPRPLTTPDTSTGGRRQRETPTNGQPTSDQPRTLPYEAFAEAVRGSPKNCSPNKLLKNG